MSDETDFGDITFDLPKNQSNVIKVIGVGGGGSNAINHMFQQGIKGVDFVVCNTDAQALNNSPVPNKVQLGVTLTEGLGAGANPEVGEQAAMENLDDIRAMLEAHTKMVFITAGMGGGTGTGAAPIIAKMATEMGILSVGIVTSPFAFEGTLRNEQARKGIENLRRSVDSLVVINNNKLREVYGNLGFKAGFSKADEVLSTAARGIAEVITHHYTQNIDLRDAKTVLAKSGTAIMGSATAAGSKRAEEAIQRALDSPLLNDNKISGAKNVLLLIVSGSEEITIDEIGEINDHIQAEAGNGANIIMGVGEDEALGDAISATVIATGFDADQQHEIINTEAKKIIHNLEDEQETVLDLSPKKTYDPLVTSAKQQRESPEKEEEVIRHTLLDDEDDHILIPTTELLKNIEVVYEHVEPFETLDEFVITPVTPNILDMEVIDAEIVRPEEGGDGQITLTFDMPLAAVKKEEVEDKITFELTEDIKDMDVLDPTEVIPVTDVNSEGVRRYSLDDYMEKEEPLSAAGAPSMLEAAEPALTYEKKEESIKKEETAETAKEVDPLTSSIDEAVRARADERKRTFKEYNYKFTNNRHNIDEIEKKPAYKRAGIELDETTEESKLSKTSVSIDSNDEVQLRSNNSFLHDNVD